LLDSKDQPISEVSALLDAGYAVIGVDLLGQGKFLVDDKKSVYAQPIPLGYPKDEQHIKSWELFHGYNWSLFSHRVHDVLATIRAIQTGPLNPSQLHLVGEGKEAGPIALAARVQSDSAISKTAVATHGFRFTSLTRRDDPMFLPGAVKYDGIDGLKRLIGNAPLWFNDDTSGELDELTGWIKEFGSSR
jgi:hypothetical protein